MVKYNFKENVKLFSIEEENHIKSYPQNIIELNILDDIVEQYNYLFQGVLDSYRRKNDNYYEFIKVVHEFDLREVFKSIENKYSGLQFGEQSELDVKKQLFFNDFQYDYFLSNSKEEIDLLDRMMKESFGSGLVRNISFSMNPDIGEVDTDKILSITYRGSLQDIFHSSESNVEEEEEVLDGKETNE